MKKIFVAVLSVFIGFSFCFSASAHTTKQSSVIQWGESVGGEGCGWSIHEDFHTNGTSATYKFDSADPYLTDTYKKYATDGAALWNGIFTFSQSANSANWVYTADMEDTTVVALCWFEIPGDVDSSGHLKRWFILMNRRYPITKLVLAHEFGHAIGLGDLYNSYYNSDKLMYGYVTGGTATAPTTADKNGVRVITGTHSSHTFAYKRFDQYNGLNRHIRACTDCKAYANPGGIGFCSYNANNICSTCGGAK